MKKYTLIYQGIIYFVESRAKAIELFIDLKAA